jgi:small GTP-binding protein
MVQLANQQESITDLKGKIVSVYEYLSEHQDFQNAEKIKQLANKLKKGEFVIAFCGHFSAGKSTMINKVVGENLLPSSPIPTSANLVRVRSGEEYAKVFFKNEKPRMYLAPYDYELVKQYCKDGDQIKEIEISHRESKLPANTIIMDTPGIDSADDAHRIATESAIHLADFVFYVMDYNHVQSELNFLFTKELTEAGKEVYLVINQIDKHNEEELSFQDFQKSVVESFSSWSVNPTRIFYTSLKDKDHEYNQFTDLQKFIADKLQTRDRIQVNSIIESLKKIGHDHLNQVRKNNEKILEPSHQILNDLSKEEQEKLFETYYTRKSELQLMEVRKKSAEEQFEQEMAQILKNAYLMPAETRSLAEAYLESCQPEFKVGLLFGKQKTQLEREARIERFYKDILEKTKSQLEWHLRELLGKLLKVYEIDQSELLAKVQSFTIDFPIDLLVNTTKSGARLSGNYVLNYTDDLANEIKKIAKNRLINFQTSFFDALNNQTEILKEQYTDELKDLNRYLHAFEEIQRMETKIDVKKQKLEQLLQRDGREHGFNHLFVADEDVFDVVVDSMGTSRLSMEKSKPSIKKVPDVSHVQSMTNDQMKVMSRKLEKTAELIQDLPGFKKLSHELNERAERLENKGFTVALFGAFSAGKSSFANALMGNKVLPVSPNPTTAAINKIKPVNEDHPHGTVLVKFKEKAAMQEDLNRSLKAFGLYEANLDDVVKRIDLIEIQNEQMEVSEKTHYAFLQAFVKGYDSYHVHLGQVMTTTLDEFSDFVAKEERSCFVEWIELYFDCELTRKGITLVDTPGADSINARHTDVAFDYIKNSDAILFVTYFNHAFSKADREFLIQLGRVKESFQLDKMFFIINAIDLAENEEEKDIVEEYVQEQLVKYGIRNPHLYSLSSMLALKEKIEITNASLSGINSFEQAFYPFISNDLTKMAITASTKEINRIHDMINKLIESAMEDQTLKEQKRTDLENQKRMIKEIFESQMIQTWQSLVNQEANELIYYLKQRVFLRFGDFFKEAFNPSLLSMDGKNVKKALQMALDEFLESMGFDFAQEMRATTVRLDRFVEKVMSDFQAQIVRSISKINQDLSFSIFELVNKEELSFKNAFHEVDRQLFHKAMSYFKNPKSFFEKNEKKWMSDELYQVLNTPVDEYLKLEQVRVNHFYNHVLNMEYSRLLKQMDEQVNDFYVSLLSTLDGGVSIEQLISIKQKLEQGS